jgi:hypothetical protein
VRTLCRLQSAAIQADCFARASQPLPSYRHFAIKLLGVTRRGVSSVTRCVFGLAVEIFHFARRLPDAACCLCVSISNYVADRALKFTGYIRGRSRNPILVHDVKLPNSIRAHKLTNSFDLGSDIIMNTGCRAPRINAGLQNAEHVGEGP